MNTRFLETLVMLDRLKSFRQTAQVLCTTQAAVSKRIEALEEELDVPLVDRSQRGFKLTIIGEQVVSQAEQMLALERQLKLSVRPDAPPSGRVRIGVIETVVHTWLTQLIHALGDRLPAIEPDITVDTAHNLREQFRQRKFDLLIQNDDMTEAAGDGETAVAPLCRFPMRWIARPAMLPDGRDLRLEDLERVPLLTFSRTSGPRAHVRALFAGCAAEPRVCSFPSVQSIIQLTKGGFGVAAIPPIFVRDELGAGYLELRDGPVLPPMTITVAHLRDTAPAVHAVARLTRAIVVDYCVEAGERWVSNLTGA
ncbi:MULTISPECIES: LysR family transcriptional regulator [unclassified Variovorax]|jgi:DNA-binding transcriptional LysR family regulator|uniref:LysR family transcriptional regulator n=1 Tax=unclassified Variovorax TaxID=663243 RepID=UPI000F7DB3A8|nr:MULTISPECIES: LysR family transcriptional regulator [unclassified Variovorax]RSZ40988.1 LysR family transcriptional regulator [Variovorax sp. 553]RSZ42103.1 LysR family transcriptional regulator [Variovorax sp. 679]